MKLKELLAREMQYLDNILQTDMDGIQEGIESSFSDIEDYVEDIEAAWIDEGDDFEKIISEHEATISDLEDRITDLEGDQ